MAAEPALLQELAERVRPLELRSQQPTLPVVSGLATLLPGGLVRGTTVAVGAVAGVGGATTLALALAAAPSRAGAWVALVGFPTPTPATVGPSRRGGPLPRGSRPSDAGSVGPNRRGGPLPRGGPARPADAEPTFGDGDVDRGSDRRGPSGPSGVMPGRRGRGGLAVGGGGTGTAASSRGDAVISGGRGPSGRGATVGVVGVGAGDGRRSRPGAAGVAEAPATVVMERAADRPGVVGVGEAPTAGAAMWGLVAAAGMGVVLERLVVVAPPDRPASGWGPVVAALVEGFPVVVVGPQVQLRSGDGRRLAARLRERGGVLVRVGDASVPSAAHVRLLVTEGEWHGVEEGAGHLRSRRVVVEASGRGAAARLRRARLLLPGPGGAVVVAED